MVIAYFITQFPPIIIKIVHEFNLVTMGGSFKGLN